MRRALFAITGLAVGTTALVVLKGAPGVGSSAQDVPAALAPVAPGGSAAPEPPSPTGSAPAATPTGTPRASAKPTVKPSAERSAASRGGTRTRTTPAAPRTTTSAPKVTTRTVTGPSVSYEYGSLQVRITLSGSRIVDATGIGLPLGGQSGQRSDDVQARYSGTSGEVVARQSANLSTVSGATYTSTAYQQALQAALDKA
ncbi:MULTISPECIES: FMN-binding protein [unclassified Micromonospora]|uniref:FMN-binding protein n=1 Tax=unclassified Micromonospora TaxID=2617518 RepID=UPI001C24467E|nr:MULTISPECIES: FMN-binding protein [unclassified Micromonospora]MBU8856355.1 FMN-binding protein [Micromonospora sp. WMMB482]MDM4781963.1 FMN-binding protein [Micromonospora sp. b486]